MFQTTLKAFKKADFTTVREHEEFVWLHDRFVENEEYAGIIVSQNDTPEKTTPLRFFISAIFYFL